MNLVERSLKEFKIEDLVVGQELKVVGISSMYNPNDEDDVIYGTEIGDIVTVIESLYKIGMIYEECKGGSSCKDRFGNESCPCRRLGYMMENKSGKHVWSCYLLLKTMNGEHVR